MARDELDARVSHDAFSIATTRRVSGSRCEQRVHTRASAIERGREREPRQREPTASNERGAREASERRSDVRLAEAHAAGDARSVARQPEAREVEEGEEDGEGTLTVSHEPNLNP